MNPNKNGSCCRPNVDKTPGLQHQHQHQQQQQPQPYHQNQHQGQPGVCKKELALIEMIAEQMKQPPLQVNFKVGVPKRKPNCDEDENFMRNIKTEQKTRRKSEEIKKCPTMEENLKIINERKNSIKKN